MNDLALLRTHIGQKLKDLRLSRSLTLEDVAFELNISFPNYLYLEKATRGTVRLDTLCKLADFYNLPVSYFFLDYLSRPTPDQPQLTRKNATEKKLLAEFRKLNPEQKDLMLRMFKIFREKN
jgi:transcriptional regulator with XRE-family HTH domain